MARKSSRRGAPGGVAVTSLVAFVVLCVVVYLVASSALREQPAGAAETRMVEVPRLVSAYETATALERSLEQSDFGKARKHARTISELLAGALTVEEMKRR